MSSSSFVASPVMLRAARNEHLSGRRLRDDPGLMRLHRGVYAEREHFRRLRPWDRYLARVHAVAIACPDAVFCRESAAGLHGLPVFGEPRHVHVFDRDAPSTRRYGDVIVHASADEREFVTRAGVTATAVSHTAVDVARIAPPAAGLATVDAALRLLRPSSFGIEDLVTMASAQSNRRGRRTIEWIRCRATPDAESVGESISRAVLEWLGFDRPVLQYRFAHEGLRDRVDFFWPFRRIVGESDGYGKYDGSTAAATKASLIREKIREDRLRRHVRGMARWDWSDTVRGYPLGDKLHRAGLVAVRPPDRELLATLSSLTW